jgi:hypothetical protein
VHGARDVEVDDGELLAQVGVDEASVDADPCIESGGGERTPDVLQPPEKVFDPLGGGEVRLDGDHLGSEVPELGRGSLDLRVLGGDQEVEVVPRELACERAADAAGRSRDEGEWSLVHLGAFRRSARGPPRVPIRSGSHASRRA